VNDDVASASARLRVLVVDDEWVARNYLTELVHASGLAEVAAAVATAGQAVEVLKPAPQGIEVDAVLLDVCLAGPGAEQAGLELARSIGGLQNPPAIVLATAFGEHALAAYELGVVDYLQKPFTAERVFRCLRRVRAARPQPPPVPALRRVVARKGKSLVFLTLSEAFAFEASGRLVCVHSARGRLDVDSSLASLESQLSGHVLRVHRNWLVNVARVLELVKDGAENFVAVGAEGPNASPPLLVPVTRERAAEVRAALLARTSG
jgi:two-component system response regulator AlgR